MLNLIMLNVFIITILIVLSCIILMSLGFLINGKISGAISRIPKKRSFLSNISKGAKPVLTKLTKIENKISRDEFLKYYEKSRSVYCLVLLLMKYSFKKYF